MKNFSSMFPIEKMCKTLKVSRSAYYGSPRITLALRNQGIRVSRNRVARIMKKENLRSIIRKKFVVTTDSKHNYPVVGNLLKRNFHVHGTGKVWVSYITYVRTSQGWLYLTVIIDLGDRKVIGWSLSRSLKASEGRMCLPE